MFSFLKFQFHQIVRFEAVIAISAQRHCSWLPHWTSRDPTASNIQMLIFVKFDSQAPEPD
jgi:hypothetical protein